MTDGSKYGRRVVLRPLAALRGALPEGSRSLRTRSLTSCGFEGGGRAVWGPVGSLAIIFEGVEPYGFGDLTIDSVLAKDAQSEQLLSVIRGFVESHPEYQPAAN